MLSVIELQGVPFGSLMGLSVSPETAKGSRIYVADQTGAAHGCVHLLKTMTEKEKKAEESGRWCKCFS